MTEQLTECGRTCQTWSTVLTGKCRLPNSDRHESVLPDVSGVVAEPHSNRLLWNPLTMSASDPNFHSTAKLCTFDTTEGTVSAAN